MDDYNVERATIIHEAGQLCSDFLLQIWLMVDKMLPEQFTEIRDGLKIALPDPNGRQRLSTVYSNYMLFLCVSNTLNEKESLTMGQLSRTISVNFSAATHMVDWMVASDYAIRLTDSDDRRIVRVALTDKGRNLSKDAKKFLFEHVVEFWRRLPNEQRKSLLINMKEVIDAGTAVLEDSP